jgi:putative NIF3 family GTP cyclohydrolase 1 type 2
MRMTHLSRREFVALAASSAVTPLAWTRLSAAAPLTVDAVIERVKAHVGVEWKAGGLDTIKAGAAETVVTGIATTSMATLDVLRRAVAGGANLVVTLEPTFFSKADGQTPVRGRGSATAGPDPVFDAKKDFIQKNGLAVWRFSDHWRLRRPDPLLQGLGETLGWTRYQVAGDPSRVEMPARTLGVLAGDLKKALGARGGIRVVGDPSTPVRRVGLLPGSTPIAAALAVLPSVDVIVAGEVREWETVVYAQDTVASGQRKGLILVGRVVSEEPSMRVCATWLQTLVPEVQTQWLPVGDPYWRPV